MNEEVVYIEALNSFSKSVCYADKMARNGAELPKIKTYLKKTINAYCILIDIDNIPVKKHEEKVMIQKKSNQNIKPWILCPECGKRLIRLNPNTRFCNLPVFCKRCKKEYIMNPR